MTIHKVTMSLPKYELTNNDVEFEIWANKKKIGELHLSKGDIQWWPRGNKKKFIQINWTDFAYLIEHGALSTSI